MSVLALRTNVLWRSNARLVNSLTHSRGTTAVASGRRTTAKYALAITGCAAGLYMHALSAVDCMGMSEGVPLATAVPMDEKRSVFASDEDGDGRDPMERIIDMYGPHVMKSGFGGGVGFCSGMAAKKLGYVVAYLVGIGFMGLQVASYNGYIDVDWFAIRDEAVQMLDTDGDGKLDMNDAKRWWNKFKDVMTRALPSSSGFVGGFILGLKYG